MPRCVGGAGEYGAGLPAQLPGGRVGSGRCADDTGPAELCCELDADRDMSPPGVAPTSIGATATAAGAGVGGGGETGRADSWLREPERLRWSRKKSRSDR